ncbi:MAG TPA: alanyl-tRNA editing protein [Acidobacteriota bacterium]|nr:alanyl-tRNA editing protein [Acidobacteriota bacterium]
MQKRPARRCVVVVWATRDGMPMTEQLFQLDAAVREFDAVVEGVDAKRRTVVLNRTAFYPGGGGQPCDHGLLGLGDHEVEVVKVFRAGAEIVHTLDGPVPPVRATVHGALDWSRRHALMRTHTALHILCGVVWRDYGAQVTGGSVRPLTGRLDFELEALSAELACEIEEKLNVEVDAARQVRVALLPRAEALRIPDLIRTKVNLLPEGITQIRTVEIVGLDLQADGGTHVANTREVGRIRIAGHKNKGRINKRIEIELASPTT